MTLELIWNSGKYLSLSMPTEIRHRSQSNQTLCDGLHNPDILGESNSTYIFDLCSSIHNTQRCFIWHGREIRESYKLKAVSNRCISRMFLKVGRDEESRVFWWGVAPGWAALEKAPSPRDMFLVRMGGAGCLHQQNGVCQWECVDGEAQSDRVGPCYGGL